MPPESGEDRNVGIDAKRIVAPVTGGDHSSVKVEDPLISLRSKVAIGRRSQVAGNGAMTLKRS